jgi:hypothetical protein
VTGSNGGAAIEVVEGVVEATNETGVRIAGAWLDRSRFHHVDLPELGTRVRLEVDAKGFLRSVEVLETAPAQAQASSRERAISRLAVLKAAAAFGASRPDCKSTDVLQIADRWLA